MECFVCKQIKQPTKEIKIPCITCDVCKKIICLECSELSPTEIRCIPLQKRILQYKCKQCRYEVIEILQNAIKDKDVIIEMLKDKIKNLEEQNGKNTYANILKVQQADQELQTVKRNIPKMIIKPKNKQSLLETKKDLTSIDPTEIKVGIKNMISKENGTILIKCDTESQVEKLMEAAKQKYDDKYEIKLTKMRNPKIKIPNFDQDMAIDEIQKCINTQNGVGGDLKVTYVKTKKNGSKIIYCDTCSLSFKTIMNLGKLNIGWQRYSVYEDLGVLRCYKCQGFHHKMNDCKNDIVCPLCSGSHEKKDCETSQKCCANCKFANDKFKKSYSTDHSPIDPKCPSLVYNIEVLKSKTNY